MSLSLEIQTLSLSLSFMSQKISPTSQKKQQIPPKQGSYFKLLDATVTQPEGLGTVGAE